MLYTHMAEEVWKQHHIYDLYEGSSFGRVRFIGKANILKPTVSNSGYHYVMVRSSSDSKQKHLTVHRFIYSCFHEDFDLSSNYHIDHINDVKTEPGRQSSTFNSTREQQKGATEARHEDNNEWESCQNSSNEHEHQRAEGFQKQISARLHYTRARRWSRRLP